MSQSTSARKKGGRAKNNLNDFDINQIEADLLAVEAETLGIDPQTIKNKSESSSTITNEGDDKSSNSTQNASFKPHPVNVVNFNPDNSRLLHRVLRTDSSQKPVDIKKENSRPAQPRNVSGPVSETGPKVLKFKSIQKNPVANTAKTTGGMDGFKKPSGVKPAPNVSIPEAISRPVINTSSVALSGMSRANQFNRYVLEQHKTSLQNQLEKKSLFERSLDGDVEIYDKGLQTNNGKKVYNVKRRKSMLGGVDQYNLGPGKLRKTLKYKPMRLILPVLTLFTVGAYVMYLNIPTINLKVAENKSGIAVSEPSYVPDGYKLSNSVEAETGKVAMSFIKDDQQKYNVSQKVSDWDSKALLENKILKETDEYSAYTDRGLTIYVYENKATWVNQGKIYEIELSGSGLDTEELVRIAGSM